MRSLARETVFKFIFSKLFNSDDEGLFSVLCKELSEDDKKFAERLLNAVEENQEQYLEALDSLATSYKLNRIINADKCAIIIGMAELNAFPETDVPIIIDEAVKLCAKFSTENSVYFVNGILGEYANRIRG